MPDEARRSLSHYRLEKASESLYDAERSLQEDRANNAANRAYYAIFHAVRAVFALDKKDYQKHSALLSFFSKDYILTGQFPASFGKAIRNARALRETGDYDDFMDPTPEEAAEAVQLAKEFLEAVKNYVEDRIAKEEPS